MSKITRDHLQRQAFVYVYQSTMDQVQNNRESQCCQYSLTERLAGGGRKATSREEVVSQLVVVAQHTVPAFNQRLSLRDRLLIQPFACICVRTQPDDIYSPLGVLNHEKVALCESLIH